MIDLVWGGASNPHENQIMKAWAEDIIWNGESEFGSCTTMGVVEGENLIGVIVFHNYDAKSRVIEYSGASTTPRWLVPRSLAGMFGYIFDDLNCQMCVTRNSEYNTRLHRQLKAFSHKPHRIERLAGPNEAEFLWTLTREDWAENKFNKRLLNGQEISTVAA